MTSGWLFDIYPLQDRIVLWIKDKGMTRIEVEWTPSLYVASSKYHLERLKKNYKIKNYTKDIEWVKRRERVYDTSDSTVLKITTKNALDLLPLGKKIEELDEYGVYRLYNVDIPPEQTFLYEQDLFPLGKYEIKEKFTSLSEIEETDYILPEFTMLYLKVTALQKQKIPKFSDKIKSIQINDTLLHSLSEEQIILDCIQMIKNIDPDFIITENGDSWDIPYLVNRATKNKIESKLVLGREKNHPINVSKNKGTSYFSYGQVHFKPSASKILGRIHIDKSNCFLWAQDKSLEGIFEISRTCRLPMHTAARASIGKCMSSVQFYNATRHNLLVPWKPVVSEIFKSRMSLLIGDRGGLILEPQIGVHENVGEVDFASLFGNIMLKKNISAETIDCKCCTDSKNLVPDLGYHICKRQGIVPQSLKLLLDKRQRYTKLIETITETEKQDVYKKRKAALKWILVTSFGYLGFNNAKFGRIDAHMAVCAFARHLLLDAIHIAEKNEFKVLHGIVDSIWIFKEGATRDDYDLLRREISTKTGFELSLDVYKWIVFLPSKESKIVPVPNRYFGANQNGELKIRGIEARRHDTPKFFNKCQYDILKLFATCNTKVEIKQSLVEAKKIMEHYRMHLLQKEVPIKDLVFTNRVTRGTDQHKGKTIQSDALNQLKWEGKQIAPGQKIQYVITDYSRKISKRVVPVDLLPDKYDEKRYSEILDECCNSVIEPFLN